jgi:hypothetical protein
VGDAATEVTLLQKRFPSEEARDNHAEGWEVTFAQLEAALP